MRIFFFLILSSVLSHVGFSQNDELEFSYRSYLELVKDHHPITYQADLLREVGNSTQKMARGGFDPKVEAAWNQKSFDDKNYYSLASGVLKVPTWYGIDLKAGYDRNSGQFLNESDAIPTRGLWNAGISVPLGKGLVIDKRRAALKKAGIFKSSVEQEQFLMINELLFKASEAYLTWQTDYALQNVAEEGVRLAQQRFVGTRSSFLNGDKPAIDTLESFIALQSREMDLQKSIQSLENSKINVENYLWIDGVTPIEIEANARPESIEITLLQYQVDSLSIFQEERLLAHPEILLYDFKIKEIGIDLRLAKEDIKPDLRINYNPLIGVAEDALFDQFNANNYKIGASFSYPILQRKQRGKIELTKLKNEKASFDRSMKLQDINTKLDIYINNMKRMVNQYQLQVATLANYNSMLIAENRKFQAGESSVFLVNSREKKYLESQYKQVGINQKLIYNRLAYLLFSAGFTEI